MSTNHDNDELEKKRIRLIPEVLPDPTARAVEGSPRQRTLANMERLLAIAAVTTIMAGCSDKSEPANVTPSTSATTSTEHSTTPPPPHPSLPPPEPKKPKPPREIGYGVVDPMPHPYRPRPPESAEDQKKRDEQLERAKEAIDKVLSGISFPELAARSTESIRKAFDTKGGQLADAYNKALLNDDSLSGSIHIKLSINKTGEVTSCEVLTDINDDFKKTLLMIIKKIDFGPAKNDWKGTYTLNLIKY